MISSPSGGGKTSLIRALLKQMQNLQISISYTTRPARPSEEEGKDYYFVSEKIFQQQGLNAFTKNEKDSAKKLLTHGPFKGFLEALHQLQQKFSPENCPVRTALVTARQAPTHERVIRTLRAWHIRIDEALFLGGLSKGEFLRAFKADIFFDDYEGHCDSARQYVATAQVLSRQS